MHKVDALGCMAPLGLQTRQLSSKPEDIRGQGIRGGTDLRKEEREERGHVSQRRPSEEGDFWERVGMRSGESKVALSDGGPLTLSGRSQIAHLRLCNATCFLKSPTPTRSCQFCATVPTTHPLSPAPSTHQ